MIQHTHRQPNFVAAKCSKRRCFLTLQCRLLPSLESINSQVFVAHFANSERFFKGKDSNSRFCALSVKILCKSRIVQRNFGLFVYVWEKEKTET